MSLHGSYDSENVFAQILRGEMPAAQIIEEDHAIAIMDAFPQTRGHCLVIPKAESRNLLGASPKDMGRIFGLVQRVTQAVDKALSPSGIIISQFNGAPAGQTVFHTHVHIIPRYDMSDMAEHAQGRQADMNELEALAGQIRAALD
ncbi:HIT family protein [Algimonas porphyrae]|uniref:Hydrolase n=1 Tax=Algimonas porphyrae TaxID=1128113 RepID=A0ABQ5V245_9PROT|nr:HIT family protein [Algimonas porphyrae]GLQ21130.1 hydrolase [Algimonas porphyrae]